jgi:class 3 adenylate cyclase
LVGDTVNLSQRLQDLARPAGTTVVSRATVEALSFGEGGGDALPFEAMPNQLVKGRETPIDAFRLPPDTGAVALGAGAQTSANSNNDRGSTAP